MSHVNSWLAWLEHGEFVLAIYFKARSIVVHIHVGSFDKALYISRYGISVE